MYEMRYGFRDARGSGGSRADRCRRIFEAKQKRQNDFHCSIGFPHIQLPSAKIINHRHRNSMEKPRRERKKTTTTAAWVGKKLSVIPAD